MRAGDPTPDGVGMFETFQPVTMNDAGQVAINTSLTNAGNTVVGIFLGNGTAPLMQIVRAAEAIPDGSTVFSEFNDPEVNNAGQVVFGAFLGGPPGTVYMDTGIYLSDGSDGLAQIARVGDRTPNGAAAFTRFASRPSLNDAGDVVFIAGLTDAATGGDQRSACIEATIRTDLSRLSDSMSRSRWKRHIQLARLQCSRGGHK